MAPETLAEAERLILRGDDLDAVAEAVGVARRTLERAFVAAHGLTPARWRKAQRGEAAEEGNPVVAFRLAECDQLAIAAAADGMEPSAWAKAAVRRALADRGKAR
jgi:methylphosphotriester-DNA--protein-cysteine methyltransferase